VEKYSRTGQVTDENMAHALCMLYASGHKHTLTICNTYCLSTATMFVRKRLSVTVIRTLSVWLNIFKAKIDCVRMAQKLPVFIRYPSDPQSFLHEGIPRMIFHIPRNPHLRQSSHARKSW